MEAVGEKSERNTRERENRLQRNLQVADLRAGERELIANQRDERRNGLAIREIDKSNQRQHREQTNLVGRD